MRIPPLTVVLALFAFALAHPAAAGKDEDAGAFFNSSYSYCDARVLAAYWKVEVYEAKARIGAELSGGSSARKVDLTLAQARKKLKGKNRVMCDFWETRYVYDDAAALAGAWGTSIEDAKVRIGREVSLGRSVALDNKLLALGRTPGQQPEESAESVALNAFWNSGLGYCDAELLAALWGADVYQVKVDMGGLVQRGETALLDTKLSRAREAAQRDGRRCEFWGTPYTPDDAQALATFWHTGLDDAKARIADKYTAGGRATIDPLLQRARGK